MQTNIVYLLSIVARVLKGIFLQIAEHWSMELVAAEYSKNRNSRSDDLDIE